MPANKIRLNNKSNKNTKQVRRQQQGFQDNAEKRASRSSKRGRRRNQNINSRAEYLSLGPNQLRDGWGVGSNPADPRTTTSLGLMGNTVDGRKDAMKILHPSGESSLYVGRIPDGALSTSVMMERRDEYDIAKITDAQWGCCVITLPFIYRRMIAVLFPMTSEPTQDVIALAIATEISSSIDDLAKYPDYHDATGITGGFITTLTPNVLNNDPSLFGTQMRSVRRSCLGVTTDLDASDLYNEGRVVSGQWAPSVSLEHYDSLDSGTLDTTDLYIMQLPAMTQTTIVQSDEYRRQAEAKTGEYMPLRPAQSDWDMTEITEIRPIGCASGNSYNLVSPNTAQTANDLWLRGWCVGVELWTNLDPHAQLRIKVVEDLELVPAPGSLFSPFTTPGHPKDDRALSIIREYCRTQPHAFGAECNEKNTMLNTLVSGLGQVLSNLGIPVLSQAANPLAGLINQIFGW